MIPTPDLLPFVKGLAFHESPRWHDGALWFSDFYERCVSRVTPNGTVLTPDGRTLIVGESYGQ